MNESTKIDFLAQWTFQDYLAFGYLYLLILGVVSDSIFYGLLGVNIISYSTILDVLLSPIVRLTDSLVFPALIIVLPGVGFFYIKQIGRIEEKRRERKRERDPEAEVPSSTMSRIATRSLWFSFTCMIIFAAFMGYGIGGGLKQSGRLEAGTLTPDHELILQDGGTEYVKVLGNNSEYVFYVRPGEYSVSASAIKETLNAIRELSESEKQAFDTNG